MTRVNLIPPTELSDQHLMAEYREIPMVCASLRRSLASPNFSASRIPPTYRLGTGHVMFFYDKGKWLRRRYEDVIRELRLRGYALAPEARDVDWSGFLDEADWQPSGTEIAISRERVMRRIELKPHWYRWSIRPVPPYQDNLKGACA